MQTLRVVLAYSRENGHDNLLCLTLHFLQHRPRRGVKQTIFDRASSRSGCRLTQPLASKRSMSLPSVGFSISSAIASSVCVQLFMRFSLVMTRHCARVSPNGSTRRS